MPKRRKRSNKLGHCEACHCWHKLTIHHRVPRRYPDLTLELLRLHGIVIPKYTCKVCRSCHDFIEGTREYCCANKRLGQTRCLELRIELGKIDKLAGKLLMKRPEQREIRI